MPPQHHYIVQAAIVALDKWVTSGTPPAKTPRIELTGKGSTSDPIRPVLDANGNTKGGVRSPWMDVPTARYSANNPLNHVSGILLGSVEPFDKQTLERLYPGGKSEYLKKFEAALDVQIKAGHILAADKDEILGVAALSYK